MKAISIRQPWAWLIINAGKDIENRDWATRHRGPTLIHAAKGLTISEYEDAAYFAQSLNLNLGITMPAPKAMPRGGIIGIVDIVDCVSSSKSKWFFGKFGFVLQNPRLLPFIEYKGQLGFFDVPDSLISGATNESL